MNVLENFRQVTTFVFDVDGVLTDGRVLLLENGLQARRMNIKDGLALQMAMKQGYKVVVVSGGNSEPVRQRLQYLGIPEIHLGVTNKLSFVEQFCSRHNTDLSNILYMGDDLPDITLLKKAGLASCPADAVPEVKACCSYVSPRAGGDGCVRDVIEKVLKLAGKWQVEEDLVSK